MVFRPSGHIFMCPLRVLFVFSILFNFQGPGRSLALTTPVCLAFRVARSLGALIYNIMRYPKCQPLISNFFHSFLHPYFIRLIDRFVAFSPLSAPFFFKNFPKIFLFFLQDFAFPLPCSSLLWLPAAAWQSPPFPCKRPLGPLSFHIPKRGTRHTTSLLPLI